MGNTLNSPICAICKCPATRMVVRDDYDGIRRSYKLPLSIEDEDRMYGALDAIPESYKHAQCELTHPSEDDLYFESQQEDE